MQIQLNGRAEFLRDEATIAEVLHRFFPGGRRVAVEVNLEIVPRSRHDSHRLREGDRVEIVQAIGGG